VRVIRLRQSGLHYTSNVYLVLGTRNRICDINALVDVGRDPAVMHELKGAPTGLGKRKVNLVILTHCHYDHCEMLARVRDAYHPQVRAFSRSCEGVDTELADGEMVTLGDEEFEVIAAHAHSSDSICLYNERTGTLFSGDVPLIVNSADRSSEPAFVAALRRIASCDVRVIYPGHGAPLTENCNERLRASFRLLCEAFQNEVQSTEEDGR
jgi:glyoxylase-like metal-dependent hydrolase (beta-lactamase superfamily II)